MSIFKKKNNATTSPAVGDEEDQGGIASSKVGYDKAENITDSKIKEFERYVPGDQMPKEQSLGIFYNFLTLLSVMAIHLGIPLGLTYGIRHLIGVGPSLLVAAAPPIIWVTFHFLKDQKIDELGCVSALGYIFCGAVSFIPGDERTLLIRDSAVIAAIGAMFLVTLIPIKTKWFVLKPLTHLLANKLFSNINYQWIDHDGYSQEDNVLDWLYEHVGFFRWCMRLQTAGWGILFVFEVVICALLVKVSDRSTQDIDTYNDIINGVFIAFMVIVTIITSWYTSALEKSIGKRWAEANDFTQKFRPESA
ncbi:hypothetical protein BDA99DRAFT_520449 [Phascolomyces articulosus]|uniref:Uncharacterized protein n=1 Tax=Phascolomyces articulosus TaxID=60185 RepID=A0AAD5JSZ3_9FUNG|nr:hypothetical protein BDA99DRAFT_520449 [Phascolomyces articulosus]